MQLRVAQRWTKAATLVYMLLQRWRPGALVCVGCTILVGGGHGTALH
jgi:hypothetical protein